MARNGLGTHVLPAGQPVVSGTTISSTVFNAFASDVSNALTTSLATDGQTPMTANLPMGNNKITGLASGTLATDALSLGQLAAPSGSGLMGLNATLNYAVGTIGAIIVDSIRDVRMFPWLAKGDGATDDTAAIQAAINSLGARGGDILLPSGLNFLCASPLSFTGLSGVRLVGQGSATAGAGAGSKITFSQTTGTSCIDAKSTYGFSTVNLFINQTGAGFSGSVIDYNHSVLATDSAYGKVQNCFISCVSTANGVDLGQAIDMEVSGNTFSGGKRGIYGGTGGYTNRVLIQNNTFNTITTMPIECIGTASNTWTLISNTFEQLAGSSAGALKCAGISGLTYLGNFHGDANTVGTWVDFTSGSNGVLIAGNIFAIGAKSISFEGATAHQGIKICGNTFSTVGIAVDIASAAGGFYGDIYPNFYYTVTTVLSGTPTVGKYQTINTGTVMHAGQHAFSNLVANSIGPTESGTLFKITNSGVSNVPFVMKGWAGQVTNLTEWRDSTEAVVAKIRPAGGVKTSAPESNYYAGDFENTSATNPYGVRALLSGVTGGAGQPFFIGQDAGGNRFVVAGTGNVTNTNNSYGAISDIKLKENIVDSTPKLSSLMKVRIVNYNLKTDKETKQLGVVAQEIEKVFPGMVSESEDFDSYGNSLGTTTKSVKYSVFVPMLIKAMQEQQVIIDSLSRRIDELSGK